MSAVNPAKNKLLNITIGINFIASFAYNIAIIISLFQMSLSRLNNTFSTKGISVLVALIIVYLFINLLLYNLMIKPEEIVGLGRYLSIAFLMLFAAILCGVALGSLFFLMF